MVCRGWQATPHGQRHPDPGGGKRRGPSPAEDAGAGREQRLRAGGGGRRDSQEPGGVVTETDLTDVLDRLDLHGINESLQKQVRGLLNDRDGSWPDGSSS